MGHGASPFSVSTLHYIGSYPWAPREAVSGNLGCYRQDQWGWTGVRSGPASACKDLCSLTCLRFKVPLGRTTRNLQAIATGMFDSYPNNDHILAINVFPLYESQEVWVLSPLLLSDCAQVTLSLWASLPSIIRWGSWTQWSWRRDSVLLCSNG